MAGKVLILGDDGTNTLQGTAADDLIYGFDPNGVTSNLSSIAAERISSGLSQPIFVAAPPGDNSHIFIVERTGTIKVFDLETRQTSLFIDLSAEITTQGECGLLGLAFAPDYAQSGYFYVHLNNLSGDTEIRRYEVFESNSLQADTASALQIISIDQPTGRDNHKGGWLGFGPDGYLYSALGDGGGGGDPDDNGQSGQTLLGKMLRLDVSSDGFPGDAQRNYAIPTGNPFVGTSGVLPEIWALGLRNPFRASFDRELGAFYIADVGQAAYEEIDIGQSGANYGWDVFEGPGTFEPGQVGPGTLTAPIYYYDHSVGHAVIGGYVYCGVSDGLQGQYFFSDVVDSKILTLHWDGASWIATDRTAQISVDAGVISNPTAFGEDGNGNLYVMDLDGEIFRLTPVAASQDQADVFIGGDGNDTIHGGAGQDRANYVGPVANYAVTLDGDGVVSVADNSPGSADGADKLYSVETLQFVDAVIMVSGHQLTQHNADGTSTVSVYSASGRLDFAADVAANGTTISATDYDQANQFSWNTVTNAFDGSGHLLAQRGTYDDDTSWLNAYDAQERLDITWHYDGNGVTRTATDHDQANQFSWNMVINAFHGSGHLLAQRGVNDDSTSWLSAYDGQERLDITWRYDGNGVTRTATDYDQASQFNWNIVTNAYDGSGHLLAQRGVNDDSTSWLSAYDAQERLDITWHYDGNGVTRTATDYDQANQFIWNTVTNAFDAAGSLYAHQGANDDGTSWLSGYDAQERLDITWLYDVNGVTRIATDYDQADHYTWSIVTNTFDANGNFVSQDGTFDNGATWHI